MKTGLKCAVWGVFTVLTAIQIAVCVACVSAVIGANLGWISLPICLFIGTGTGRGIAGALEVALKDTTKIDLIEEVE